MPETAVAGLLVTVAAELAALEFDGMLPPTPPLPPSPPAKPPSVANMLILFLHFAFQEKEEKQADKRDNAKHGKVSAKSRACRVHSSCSAWHAPDLRKVLRCVQRVVESVSKRSCISVRYVRYVACACACALSHNLKHFRCIGLLSKTRLKYLLSGDLFLRFQARLYRTKLSV